MASGVYLGGKAELDYSLYIGNGQREQDGIDKNRDTIVFLNNTASKLNELMDQSYK